MGPVEIVLALAILVLVAMGVAALVRNLSSRS